MKIRELDDQKEKNRETEKTEHQREKQISVQIERIERKIYLIRGQKVMLDHDLAELYGVSTKRLNEQVKRNMNRFPADFMFSLTRQEIMRMSQIATSSSIKFSKSVSAFTENGIAMLSSVLHTESAIQVNIQIMRAFTQLRFLLFSQKDILLKLDRLENKTYKNSTDIQLIFDAIRKMLVIEEKPKRRIGFVADREGE